MAFHWFSYIFFFNCSKANLNGIVAISFNSFALKNNIFTGFYNCNRNYFTFFSKDLSHAKLFT